MQVTRITSEALQATIRRLLPSQQGFGEDLEASNVIIPVIDLTPTAEGSALPIDLQRAVSYGNVTNINITNATRTTIVNNAGFHKISVNATGLSTDDLSLCLMEIYDGSTYKTLYDFKVLREASGSGYRPQVQVFDIIAYINAGESITGTATSVSNVISGHTYRIADVNGVAVNPDGYNPQ